MEKEINFKIKKGVYCSWCADQMKRTLKKHFKIKEIEIDVLKDKVHMVTYKKINTNDIINYLKMKGYYVTIEKNLLSY